VRRSAGADIAHLAGPFRVDGEWHTALNQAVIRQKAERARQRGHWPANTLANWVWLGTAIGNGAKQRAQERRADVAHFLPEEDFRLVVE